MTTNDTPEDTELRDEITSIIYGADWKSGSIAKAHKPDVEAAMEAITLHTQKREHEAKADERQAMLDALPEKMARPESGPKCNGTAQAVRRSYNKAILEMELAIKKIGG